MARASGAPSASRCQHHAQEVGVPGVVGIGEGEVRCRSLVERGVAGPAAAATRHRHGDDAWRS